MENLNNIPESDKIHFYKCDLCGSYFDMRDLSQVAEHFHDPAIGKVDYDTSKRLGDSVENINPGKGSGKIHLN
jgi:hypothetical protein